MTNSKKTKRILITILISLFIIAWLFPVWNVLATSTKTTEQYLNQKPWILPLQVSVFKQFFSNIYLGLTGKVEGGSGEPVLPALISSLIYGIIGSIVAIFCAALAAYPLSRLKMRGRFFIFMLIFSGTMFPFQVYLIPLFKMYQALHIYDTRFGLILFYSAICIPFCILVLRNWFNDIPKEIFEAAKIDGCGNFTIFLKMIVPLSWAPFITLFLLQFTWVWNDLLFGLTLSVSREVRPIMAVLADLQNMKAPIPYPVVLASTIISSLPTVILVIAFQKHFFKGLKMSIAGE